ncbi:MBL fold metallo-hydrolase [Streptomyces sp. NPDC051917]|uniref:MBL fold metallo-hydrolase n=1 Tax=Streptomyces sp. NPDC051917 TaxID=3154754 RepID=UPI003453ED7C
MRSENCNNTFLTWQLGEVKVTRIVEMEAVGRSRFILPQATPETLAGIPWLAPDFIGEDGLLRLSVHTLVIETPTLRILVDTCIGNDKERVVPAWNKLATSFLQDLERTGFARDSIDVVLSTHLHVDHVGWNTTLRDGRWIPTFPNARYLMVRPEFMYWVEKAQQDSPDTRVFMDSVAPVWDAGLVDLVDRDHQVCPEVKLLPTRGHTPGHASVAITSRGETGLITGDFIHHPCQLARPEWSASVDFDKEESTATRRRVLADLADSSALLIGTHFPSPSAGRVVRDGGAFRLEY